MRVHIPRYSVFLKWRSKNHHQNGQGLLLNFNHHPFQADSEEHQQRILPNGERAQAPLPGYLPDEIWRKHSPGSRPTLVLSLIGNKFLRPSPALLNNSIKVYLPLWKLFLIDISSATRRVSGNSSRFSCPLVSQNVKSLGKTPGI